MSSVRPVCVAFPYCHAVDFLLKGPIIDKVIDKVHSDDKRAAAVGHKAELRRKADSIGAVIKAIDVIRLVPVVAPTGFREQNSAADNHMERDADLKADAA